MKLQTQDVWNEKREELIQWLRYNVGVGLLPVWLSWILLPIVGTYTFSQPFFDGTFLAFAVTLSGVSMSVFLEETKMELREVQRSIYFSLFMVIVIGTGALVITMLAKENPKIQIKPCWLFLLSLGGLVAAVYLNFRLAAARLALSDKDFMEKLAQRKKREMDEETEKLSRVAKTQSQVDGNTI